MNDSYSRGLFRQVARSTQALVAAALEINTAMHELETFLSQSQEERERRADSEPERFMELSQVAAHLAVSKETVRLLVDKGIIPGARVGVGSIRVPVSGYNSWARSLTPALLHELGLPEDRFEHLEVAA